MKKFINEMKKIQKEKIREYTNTWKYCSLNLLINQLEKQFNRLKCLDFVKIEYNLAELQHLNIKKLNTTNIINLDIIKRKLIHIANYSYFLFERLNRVCN